MPPAVLTAQSSSSGGGSSSQSSSSGGRSSSRWGGDRKSPANISLADLANMVSRMDEEEREQERKRIKRKALQGMGVTLPDDGDLDEAFELLQSAGFDGLLRARQEAPTPLVRLSADAPYHMQGEVSAPQAPRGTAIVPPAAPPAAFGEEGAEPTVIDRFRGLAIGGPTAHLNRNVGAPLLDIGERVTNFAANAPVAVGMGTVGKAAEYFLGDDLGAMDVGGAFAKRAVRPTFTQTVLAPRVEEDIALGRRLRGMDPEPMDVSVPAALSAPPPAAPKDRTSELDAPVYDDAGNIVPSQGDIDAQRAHEERLLARSNPSMGQTGDAPVRPNPLLEQPETPVGQLRQMTQTVNPVDGAGAVMQGAADIIQGGGLQMGSDDAYLADAQSRGQRGEAMDVAAQQGFRLSPETATPQQITAAVTAAYDPRTAESVMANPDSPHSRAMIQKSLEVVNNDPMRQDRYRQAQATATSVEDVTARLREQGFNRELTEPERRRMEKFLGGIRDEGYPNYAVFSNQAENDMLARATGTPEGPHPGARIIDSAATRAERARLAAIDDGANINRMGPDQILANDRALAVALELVRRANVYGGQPPPQAVEAVQQLVDMGEEGINRIGELRAADLGETVYRDRIEREFGPGRVLRGRGQQPAGAQAIDEYGQPRYEGQQPSGRIAIGGEAPMDVYLPDDVSRGIGQIQDMARLDREALEIEIRNRFGEGVTAGDVAVMPKAEAVRRAESGAKRADDEIDRDMQMARNSGDDEFASMLNQAMSRPDPEQRRQTWAEWWAGEPKPGPTAPKIEGAPEGETLERRVQARLDAQAIYARYGRVAGVDEANEYLRLAYGAPPIGGQDYKAWARKNPEMDRQIKSSLFHAERLGIIEPKLVHIR